MKVCPLLFEMIKGHNQKDHYHDNDFIKVFQKKEREFYGSSFQIL